MVEVSVEYDMEPTEEDVREWAGSAAGIDSFAQSNTKGCDGMNIVLQRIGAVTRKQFRTYDRMCRVWGNPLSTWSHGAEFQHGANHDAITRVYFADDGYFTESWNNAKQEFGPLLSWPYTD